LASTRRLRHRLQPQAGQRQGRQAHVVEGEHRLHQGRGGAGALRHHRLDQLLEGRLGVVEGGQGGGAHAPRRRSKPGSPARSTRSGRVLTKKPTSRSSRRRAAPRHRGGEQQLVAAAVAVELGGEQAAAAMNGVAPADGRGAAGHPPPPPAGAPAPGRRAPRSAATAAGRPAARAAGTPASSPRHQASSRSSRAPSRRRRCQAAQSAYWSGSSGSPARAPADGGGVELGRLGDQDAQRPARR
jgi:hypothetical protein